MQSPIQYVRRNDIDVGKWDASIDKSANSLIYAYSFYLDHLCVNWDALILGDYEAVMPLAWNKKWGIKYLYHPAFVQQLGVFSATAISSARLHDFLAMARSHFPFAEIFLNYNNEAASGKPRVNFILPLSAGYAELRNGYKQDMVKNLRQAAGSALSYTSEIDLDKALQGFRAAYSDRMKSIKPREFGQFGRLCHLAFDKGELLLRGAAGLSNELLASALLLQKKNRLYLMQSVTYGQGRASSANHFLIDQIIREFSGSSFILDFEGSDLPGIAHFYGNFGAVNQPYFFYRYNELPWWIGWLKSR